MPLVRVINPPRPIVAIERHVDMTVNAGAGPTISTQANIPFNTALMSDITSLIEYDNVAYDFTIKKRGYWTVFWQCFFKQVTDTVNVEIRVNDVAKARERRVLNNEFFSTFVLLPSVKLEEDDEVVFTQFTGSSSMSFHNNAGSEPENTNIVRFIYEGGAP